MKHSEKFLKLVQERKSNVQELTIDEMLSMRASQKTFVLIDVREESEWANGHLPGAIFLSKGIIERDVESKIPDTEKTIILYCGGGFRSILSAHNLNAMGYKNVYSLMGGFRSWCEKKLPIDHTT